MADGTTPDASALVAQWLPLALGIGRRWGARYPWLSDCLESAAADGLMQVARRVETGALTPDLSRFAGLVRKAAHWKIIRRLNRERVRNPLAFGPQTRAADGQGRAPTLLDLAAIELAADAPEVSAAREAAEELAALLDLAELSARSRRILERFHGRGDPGPAIAADEGVSKARVYQIATAALARVRAAAEARAA